MVAPTINSYTRLIPGFWAPTDSTWGVENRTCALRVIPGSPKSQRVEYRVAAADANPYVILAAPLASGLYGVEQQLEGGLVYGLSAALRGSITIDRGRVQQTNFHQYEPLRISEMPVVESHIIPSDLPPGGMGEVTTPAIAPAVTNAIFAATGKRIRGLPISLEKLG